jgi:HD-like signal output (HDOD) protein
MAQTSVKPTRPAKSVSTAVSVDEELWFGSSNSKLAEDAAAKSMAATAGTVLGAKPFPESARRLAELSSRDNGQVDEMVVVLEGDPALSAKLLRMVNSAAFGLRQRCTSIRHAITLVGSKQLHHLATTAAVLDMFGSEGTHAASALEHSAIVGAFCRYLGVHLGLPAEDLFTAGVLHDIGKLMLLETYGERYQRLLDAGGCAPDTLFSIERAEYGFDHGVLAAHVFKSWNIPDPIPKIVAWHHEPTRAFESGTLHASLVQVLRLADALVYAFSRDASRAELGDVARQGAASYLDISEAQLDAMWNELAALYAKTLRHKRGESNDESPIESESSTRVKALQDPQQPRDVPQQFRCAHCGDASFGATCPACGGYVCPKHPVGVAGWCCACEVEYPRFVLNTSFPITPQRFGIGVAVVTVASTSLGWFAAGESGLYRGLAIVAFVVAVAGAAVVVAKRSYLRARFLRFRASRSK